MEGPGTMLHQTTFRNDNEPNRAPMPESGTRLLRADDHVPTNVQTPVERAPELQKLGKSILQKLFSVPVSPYAILDHQQHFQSWLESLSEQDQLIFTTDQSMYSLTDPPAAPFTPTQLYAYETGITISQLAGIVKSLFCETNADKLVLHSARLVVHTLTVGGVLNLQSRPDMETTLGKEPYANVRALVAAILRKYIPSPHHPCSLESSSI